MVLMYGARMYRVFMPRRVIVCVYMYLRIGHTQQVLVIVKRISKVVAS